MTAVTASSRLSTDSLPDPLLLTASGGAERPSAGSLLLSAGHAENSRFEKSLGLLTTKFVSLLQEAEGGVLDLKIVSW